MRALLRFFLNGLLPLAILSGAGYVAYQMLITPPHAQKSSAPAVVPVVDVVDLVPRTENVFVEAHGVVVPSEEVVLRPEVGGRIVERHPSLVPGGLLKKGEVLVRIDPAEYEIAVRKAEAELVQAQATCDMEQGQQTIARREWNLLEDRLNEMAANQSLVLREPQLQRCEAQRDAAQTALDKARLDLERTTVLVPFDCIVTEESVEIGQLVDRQNQLATLIGTDEFWVKAAVYLDRLPRISFPQADGTGGSEVRVILKTGRGEPALWKGRVVRLLGDLDPKGRQARVLVSIWDPLNLEDENKDRNERLLVGSYVTLDIEGGVLEGVYSIPWPALRENDYIWVRTPQNTLQIREVDIVWKREEDVLISDGVQPGDQLIATRLANVIPDMAIKVADRKPGSATPEQASLQPTQPSPPPNSRS